MAEELDSSVDSADEKLELSMMNSENDVIEDGVEVPALDGSFVEVDAAEHQCAICNKTYSTKHNLNRHIRLHYGSISCKTCSAVCENDDALKEHMSQRHSGLFMCEECGVEYISKQALQRHRTVKQNLEHQDKKECPYESCGKVFAERQKIQHYINSQLKVKPFKCNKDSCNKSFASRFVRNRHSKTCGVDRGSSLVSHMIPHL